jgi:hypothetical protein
MSIADRVAECIHKYEVNELDNALIQVCVALDGTAKREFPKTKKVGERFKAFIGVNQDIISFYTLGNVFVDCQFGQYTLQEFIYKVLRCGLLHEGDVPTMLKFVEPGMPITLSDQQWSLPKTFIFGTLLSVIGASSNSQQVIAYDCSVSIMGNHFNLESLWGRADVIRKASGIHAFPRLPA